MAPGDDVNARRRVTTSRRAHDEVESPLRCCSSNRVKKRLSSDVSSRK